jgi:hypothetical protein
LAAIKPVERFNPIASYLVECDTSTLLERLRDHGGNTQERRRKLEGLSASVARHMPGGAVPGDIRYRKDLVHQINKNTGHRIKYSRVDAETGEEVSNEDIIKGYKGRH